MDIIMLIVYIYHAALLRHNKHYIIYIDSKKNIIKKQKSY